MSAQAEYATTPRYELVQISTANTAFDGSGSITVLFQAGTGAGAKGSRVDGIGASAAVSTTAGFLKFFFRESSADTWRILLTVPVPAITISAASGQTPWQWGWANAGLILQPGVQIGVATEKAEAINVHVTDAGDFTP